MSHRISILTSHIPSRPRLALESTIISHGMPYPSNLETARAVEDIVHRICQPATIGILEGKVSVLISYGRIVNLV